ncbi:MAG: PAS domain-containing protein [Parafilimonas sp.]
MKKTSSAYILLFAGIFSLCIFSFLFYKRIESLMYSYEMVNRSMQVSFQSEKFFLCLRDASVIYRDYLRTYDKNSVTEFNEKINEYPQILSYLNELEDGNPKQQESLRYVNTLAQQYKIYAQKLLASDKTQPPSAAMYNTSQQLLNTIRAEVNNIINTENKIMQERDDALNHHIYATPLFLLTFSLTSLAIIIYAFLSIIKQIKKTQKLQVSEAKFRMLIKQAPVAITIYRGADCITEIINDKALKMLGRTAEEVTGKPFFDIFPEALSAKKIHDKVLREGKTFSSSEFAMQLFRNGKTDDCFFDLVYEPLFNNAGNTIGIMAVATEITERVIARKEAEESENRFRALIENSLDVIALSDMKGYFRYVSASVKNIFGYDEAEFISKKALDFIHPDDIAKLVEKSMPMVEGEKQVVSDTVRFLHKDGSWRWVETSIANSLNVPYINAFVCNIHDVTEQKKIQDTLKQSGENFRELANFSPQIIWTARTDGYIDYYNKRWYEYTGFIENFGDQSWIPILHPDDVQVWTDAWYESVKTGNPYQLEFRFKDKNNTETYRWFLGKALPIKNNEGEIIKWFGACTDIHDQKTITEKLEHLIKERTTELTASNRDLNEAQSLAHIGSWEWNIKENKITWSNELYRIFEAERENFDISFESYTSLIHPEDREYAQKIIIEALVKRNPFDFYHRIKMRDGTIRTIHGRGKVYVDDSDEPIRMSGTAQDITETVEIQNKINKLNQTFNFAEQTSCIGSFRYNFSSGVFDYSDNLYRILGCKPREFEPAFENFTRFVHPGDLEHILSENALLNEGNISSEYLFRVIKKDGSIIHARNTGIFITEGNERVYIGTLQDITSQHDKELQLLEQNTALEEMNKELASFSYVASHDLQEPLRKIRMFTRRLIETEIASLSADGKEYFNRIDNAATRMQQLIEDLLSYSRTNTAQAHFELTDMDKLLEDVCDNLREKIVQTNTVIESSDMQSAHVIPFQFQQLFTNLINNAIKFRRQDAASKIHISHDIVNGAKAKNIPALKKGKYHHYAIKDNGIGFEPQYCEQIFGLFQRLHGRSEFEGTGIGLAICKKIAENHNGIITASGVPNKGATFNIYIPAE